MHCTWYIAILGLEMLIIYNINTGTNLLLKIIINKLNKVYVTDD